DGRSGSLEEQVLEPLASAVEMNRDLAELEADLRAVPGYAERFAAAFPSDPEPTSLANLARALAAFQRTLVSDRAPYDRYAAGDGGALDDESVRGMYLFAEAG